MNIYFSIESDNLTARFNKIIDTDKLDSVSLIFDVNKGHFFSVDDESIL